MKSLHFLMMMVMESSLIECVKNYENVNCVTMECKMKSKKMKVPTMLMNSPSYNYYNPYQYPMYQAYDYGSQVYPNYYSYYGNPAASPYSGWAMQSIYAPYSQNSQSVYTPYSQNLPSAIHATADYIDSPASSTVSHHSRGRRSEPKILCPSCSMLGNTPSSEVRQSDVTNHPADTSSEPKA